MRLVRAKEEQRRGTVDRRVAAARVGQRAAQHQDEPCVRVRLAVDALAGFVLDLGKGQPGNPPPPDDGRLIQRVERAGGMGAHLCGDYSCDNAGCPAPV